MKRSFTLGLLGLMFFVVSCKREDSVNIDQNRIYTTYELQYDAGKNQTLADATFRIDHNGGSKIELTYPARVKFRNETMSWKNISGSYQLTASGNQLESFFTYSDLNENNYTSQGVEVEMISLPFGLNSISKNGNFFLPWYGDPIRSGENVSVTIKSKEGSTQQTWEISTINSNHIILDQYKLSKITEGQAEIWIERSKEESLLTATDAGGRIKSIYRSQTQTIQLSN